MTRTIVVDSLPRDVTDVDTVSAYTDFADMRADAGRYRKNRRAYWRWVREFTAGTVTGEEALADGLSELQDLVQDQRDLARSAWVDRSVRMGFLLGTVTLGIVATPLTPVVAVGAALALGQFAWTELWNRQQAGPADTQVGGGGTGQDVVVGIGQPAAVVGQHDIVERTRHVGLGVIDGHSSLF